MAQSGRFSCFLSHYFNCLRLTDTTTPRDGSFSVPSHRPRRTTLWNTATELPVLHEEGSFSDRAATSCFVSRVISIDGLVRTCESTLYICYFRPRHWQLSLLTVVCVDFTGQLYVCYIYVVYSYHSYCYLRPNFAVVHLGSEIFLPPPEADELVE